MEELERKMASVRNLLVIICLLVTVQTAVAVYPALRTLVWGEPAFVYSLESPANKDFAATMTRLGSYGWELVTARRAVPDGEPSYEMIFKRAK